MSITPLFARTSMLNWFVVRCGRSYDSTEIVVKASKSEWEELVRCSFETDINVKGGEYCIGNLITCCSLTPWFIRKDPASSGPNGGKFYMKDFLTPIMGNAFACLKDYSDRTPEESSQWNKWCDGFLKWYLALSRIGYKPRFGSNSS